MKEAIFIFALIFSLFPAASGQNSKILTEQECYRLAAEYSAKNRGVSVLVLKDERIVFEDYLNGSAARAHFLASGTKSFAGVMLAAAIEDNLFKGFDEKVSETITEWKRDPRKEKITFRQLLSLTSGIDAGQIGRVPAYREAIDFPIRTEAGTRFEYGPAPFQIFGEALRRRLAPQNESVMDYLERRILNPIGLKIAFWRKGRDGNPLLSQGASLTAREWAKFGQFLKNGGKAGARQIIAKKYLDELTVGTKANPAYGITFWLNRAGIDPRGAATAVRVTARNDEQKVKDLYMAAGAGNQRLYVIPSLDLVVVRQGNFGHWDDQEFLSLLLFGKN